MRSWLALAWLLALTICWFWVAARASAQRRLPPSTRVGMLVCSGLAAVVRLVPAVLLPSGATFDSTSYAIVGSLFRTGHDVATAAIAEGRHPYFPLQLYGFALAHLLATEYGLPFAFLAKVLPILADVLLAALLARVSPRVVPEFGWILGLLYAVHPVAVYVCAYHGQFDAEPLLASSLAALALAAGRALASGLLLGTAIALKPWPVLFCPLMALVLPTWRQRFVLALGCGLVPLGSVLLYRSLIPGSWSAVLVPIVSNAGVPGWWGVTAVLRLLFVASQSEAFDVLAPLHPDRLLALVLRYGRWVLLATLLTLSLRVVQRWRGSSASTRNRLPSVQWLARAHLFLVVAFLAGATGFGVQYLSWVVPYAHLDGQLRWLRRFTASAVLWLLGANGLGLLGSTLDPAVQTALEDVVRVLGLPAWGVTIWWTVALGRTMSNGGSPRVGRAF